MSVLSRVIRRLFPLALIMLVPLAPAGEIDLRAPAEITNLLTPFLPDEAAPGAGGQARLQRLVGEILSTEGYFSPQIEFSEVDGVVRISVDPGPRTVIAAVDVAVDGQLAARTRQELIAGWTLQVGQPFRQQDWNSAKQQVLSRLLAENHAGARLMDSQATIDPATREARLMARYDSGPAFRFGELRIEGLERYAPSLVERHNRSVRPGAPYREADLIALQTALQSTPQFRSVLVSIDRDTPPDADGVVTAPVTVRLSERPAHRLSFGAGISSNTGARVETVFQTADLFGQAWELNTGLRIEQKKQTAFADIIFPPDAAQRRNSVGVMAQATDIQGLRTERIAIGGQQAWTRGEVETRLSLTWQDERLEPDGAPDSINRALVPNAAWTWRHVDDPFNTRDGIVLQGQVGAASKAILSTQNFIRLYGRFQQFFPVGERDTVTLRGEIGYTIAPSRDGIPQEYVFRTGGTNTVRGYSFESLGVQDGSAIVGGRYMTTLSTEYTHWLDPRWGIAAFVDAGNAVDDLTDVSLAVGYGLGARWRTPAGPIAVDVAYGQRSESVQLHFSLA
ncbi:MAG: autotransporter assembly complex family protein, partial [Azonexus sp.]